MLPVYKFGCWSVFLVGVDNSTLVILVEVSWRWVMVETRIFFLSKNLIQPLSCQMAGAHTMISLWGAGVTQGHHVHEICKNFSCKLQTCFELLTVDVKMCSAEMSDWIVSTVSHTIIGNDSFRSFSTRVYQLRSCNDLPPFGTKLCARLDADSVANVSAQLARSFKSLKPKTFELLPGGWIGHVHPKQTFLHQFEEFEIGLESLRLHRSLR